MDCLWISMCFRQSFLSGHIAYRSGRGSSKDCLRPNGLIRTIARMMSSGEGGMLCVHSKVTPAPNGNDLVVGCLKAVFDVHEGYGGGVCWASYGGGRHKLLSEVRNLEVPGRGCASRGEAIIFPLGYLSRCCAVLMEMMVIGTRERTCLIDVAQDGKCRLFKVPAINSI